MNVFNLILKIAWFCQVLISHSNGNIVDTTSFIATYMKSKQTAALISARPNQNMNLKQVETYADYNLFTTMLNDGLSKYYDKDFEGAITSFNNLLQAYPNHFEGFYNLGVVYQQAGDAVKAISYYHAALQSNPLDHRARLNLATTYHLRSDIYVAIDHYK
jgi:tetratricopeptide (TPR) repeat protein